MVRTDGELLSAGAAQGRGADPRADGRDETWKAVFAWSDRTGTDWQPQDLPLGIWRRQSLCGVLLWSERALNYDFNYLNNLLSSRDQEACDLRATLG